MVYQLELDAAIWGHTPNGFLRSDQGNPLLNHKPNLIQPPLLKPLAVMAIKYRSCLEKVPFRINPEPKPSGSSVLSTEGETVQTQIQTGSIVEQGLNLAGAATQSSTGNKRAGEEVARNDSPFHIRYKNTAKRFYEQLKEADVDNIRPKIGGLYGSVAAAFRVISFASWPPNLSTAFAPHPRQAALVHAALGYNMHDVRRSRLADVVIQTSLSLADSHPQSLQSFPEVYSMALNAIPGNSSCCLTLRMSCSC